MANPEDYGINPREIVERLAAEDGITIETPHKVTPGTAKLLAMKSIYAAFETMQSEDVTSKPDTDEQTGFSDIVGNYDFENARLADPIPAEDPFNAELAEIDAMHSPHVIDDTKPRVYLAQPGILRNIDGTDPFSRIQDGIRQRIRAGEIDATMPDLIGPNVPEARIKSSKIEGEQSQ